MTYAETAESEHSGTCEALLEAAHPEVFRRNAFRVAGLSVEATPRDISRHTERLRMMQKYNAKAASNTPLALSPPPDEHAVRDALHKLHDPEKRLIDELFWFWPHELGQGKTDEALAFLAGDDIDRAAKRWSQLEQSSESNVSMHNLAVLFHCLALDLEEVALSRHLDPNELQNVWKYWEHAFKRWKVVLDHEPFWSRLTARIRALEDPRLTTGLARRIRASLPFALLFMNATLAVRYAEAGNLEATKRQLKIMRLWEAPGDAQNTQTTKASPSQLPLLGPLAQKALREASEPLRQRIKSICKNAESQADTNPTHGDKATRDVIAYTKPLLVILDTLLSPGDATRDAAHDEVAVCALHCQVPYGNETKNWKACLELVELALPIAVGQAVRERLQDNINTVKGNLEYATCWFCKQTSADDEAALELKMYGDVTRTPTWNGVQVQWRHGTVKVPRCAQCKSAHARAADWAGGGCLLGAIIGLGGSIAISIPWLGVVIVLGVTGAIGSGIGAGIGSALLSKGIRPVSAQKEFPSVKRLLGQGWKFGEKPDTQ